MSFFAKILIQFAMNYKLLLLIMTIISSESFAKNPVQECKSENQLKVLSWNIFLLPYLSLFNNNSIRANAIADELENSDYHILVFQEAFSSKCRNILAKRLMKNFPYQYGPINKNRTPLKTNSGLWIASKIKLENLGEIEFKQKKGFDAIARKGAVLFQGEFHDIPFQLLTTHLQAEDADDLRAFQCQEIKEQLLNPHYHPKIPQLICGDFNIEMDDKHHYDKMLLTLDAQNGELSGNVKVTYDEQNNNLARKTTGRSRTIDYVLVRNTELLQNIERKVQTFLSRIGNMESNLSDHYAMEFCVSFVNRSFNQQTSQINY